MKRLLLAVFLIPFLLGGCNQQGGGSSPGEHYINVPINDVSLIEGEEFEIPVEIIKTTIVTYRSNNDDIATVSRTGVITAIKEGETTINISGGGDHFIVFVTVYPQTAKDSLQIVMVKDSFTVAKDDTFILPITVKYGNEVIKEPTLSYEYEHEGVVLIEDLTLIAKAVGTTKCLITATYGDLEVDDIFTVTVY